MKRPDLFFTALLVPMDALAIFAGALAAYHVRLLPFFTEWRPVIFDLTLERYSQLALPAVVLWVIIFAFAGAYRTSRRRLAEDVQTTLFASASAMAVIFALLFFTLEAFESRFIILVGWGLAVTLVWTERLLIRGIQNSLLFLGIGMRRAVLIGNGETGEVLRQTFETRRRYGIRVVGTFDAFGDETEKTLMQLARRSAIDEIILTDPNASRETLSRLRSFSDVEHLDLRYSADLFTVGSLRVDASTIAGVPLMTVKKTPLDGWGAIYKRGFDILLALVLVILFSPTLLFITICILFESGRPILFKNERVGEGGRRFLTFKFRSMRAEYSIGSQKGLGNQARAEKMEEELIRKQNMKHGPVYKIANDPRVTPFGQKIRKYSLDELPQLFNILSGSMSLVGPRPHQPREVDKYLPHHRKVHTIRPGMTGLAQISGRSDLDFEEEMRLDTFYMEHWSPWLDLKILMKTPFVVIFRKGAY
ncbi:sugar transferase [Candidatus Uhrbacteria bacterium]|nr:sugar transferase [Candidatus Uhrbacteria bacterium]